MGGRFREEEGGGVIPGGERVKVRVEKDAAAEALALELTFLDLHRAVLVIGWVLPVAVDAPGGEVVTPFAWCALRRAGGAGAIGGMVGAGAAHACGGGLLALVLCVSEALAVEADQRGLFVAVRVADGGFNS
jgi:hypothetical protein